MGKKVTFIILLILLSAVFAFGYLLGSGTTPETIIEEMPLTYTLPYDRKNVDQALEYLREARQIHTEYVLNPSWIKPGWGGVEFHQMWVERYQYIENLIREITR